MHTLRYTYIHIILYNGQERYLFDYFHNGTEIIILMDYIHDYMYMQVLYILVCHYGNNI